MTDFNTVFYDEGEMEAELDEFGKRGWEAVSMNIVENSTQCSEAGWTRILFKRRLIIGNRKYRTGKSKVAKARLKSKFDNRKKRKIAQK